MPDACVHDLVEAAAMRTPDALALAHGRERLSYAELVGRASRVAAALVAHGAGPEVPVGLCVEPSIDMVVGALGVLKAGAPYAPVDAGQPPARIARTLAACPIVLTQAALRARLDGVPARLLSLDVLPDAPPAPGPTTSPRNLAYVIHTSGSTGEPNGVCVTHGSLLGLIAWHIDAFAITADDRASQLAGAGFDASVWEVWPYLVAGASVHIAPPDVRSAPPRLRDWLLDERITVGFAATPLAERLLRLPWPSTAPLRCLLTGGDRLHLHPGGGLPFVLVNNYGPTEGTVVTTSGEVAAEGGDGLPGLGRPIAGVDVHVLDADLRAVPKGEPGELFIGGPSLARGYLARPGLTARRFLPDPFASTPGGRLYRTGDLVREASDGGLEFLGRIDDQVQIRGARVELGEVEATLARHPAVAEAAAAIREGAGGPVLAAVVVPHGGEAPATAGIRDYLAARLPRHMVPAVIHAAGALPVTPNGKIDRRAVLRMVAEAPPETTPAAPMTPLEVRLAGIWAAALGVDAIGRDDDFFALGGHSMLAAEVLMRVSTELGLATSANAFFEAPTVAGLAAVLSSASEPQTIEGEV